MGLPASFLAYPPDAGITMTMPFRQRSGKNKPATFQTDSEHNIHSNKFILT